MDFDYLTWLNPFDRVEQCGKQRTIILHPVLANTDQHDADCNVPQIMLRGESAIGCDKDVEQPHRGNRIFWMFPVPLRILVGSIAQADGTNEG